MCVSRHDSVCKIWSKNTNYKRQLNTEITNSQRNVFLCQLKKKKEKETAKNLCSIKNNLEKKENENS